MDVKKRMMRTVILALIGVAIGGGIALYQIKSEPAVVVMQQSENANVSQSMAGIQLGGDFTLLDQTGKTVSQDDYADQFKLIYFGFTYCPAICPTELQKMAAAMKMVEPDVAEQVQPIFISVDPERDTVEVMREYVTLFDPNMVGLTGSVEQIDAIKKKYKVFATKVQDESMTEYTVDHSSFIYLMSKDNKPLGIFRMEDGAEMIAAEMRKAVKGDF
jgi:protein SCO1